MRCFLAIELSEEARKNLLQVIENAKRTGIMASFVRAEQLHITLLFLGEKKEEEIGTIQEKLSKLPFSQFPLTVKGAGFFPNENRINVFWTGVEDKEHKLQQLHEQVCQVLHQPPEKHFVGHITLARVKGREHLKELRQAKRSLEDTVFGEFIVEKVVLKKSTLTSQGAAYEDLNSFPLK